MPMQVIASEGNFAWCEGAGLRERVDMMLVGPQAAGSWVLVFHGAARQLLSRQEAEQSTAARQALAAVLSGDTRIDEFFADLIGREPALPAHLRKASA